MAKVAQALNEFNVSNVGFSKVSYTTLKDFTDDSRAVPLKKVGSKTEEHKTDDFKKEPPVKQKDVKWGACHTQHKPLVIMVGAIEYKIYGGSCIDPVINELDVLVGLDRGVTHSKRVFPWEDGFHFLYPISDMKAPSDIVSFTKLLEFLKLQLIAGKKVFVGCIGGHGRTGTVLAALVTYMTGNLDSITYVRENYCTKAVESTEQIDFLHSNFSIVKTTPTKGGSLLPWDYSTSSFSGYHNGKGLSKDQSGVYYGCVEIASSIHGENFVCKK